MLPRGAGIAARPLLALLALALLGLLLFRLIEIRTDMADFLPPAETPEAAFLLGELREGAATTLLLAGIEGAEEAELARLSRATGEAMRATGRFAFVGNGTADLTEAEGEMLFRYRYLLAPSEGAFEVPALRRGLEALLDGLRSSLSGVLSRLGFADPTGIFMGTVKGWLGASTVEVRRGVWFAGGDGPPRALMVARSRALGTDTEAQREAAEAVRAAFAGAEPGRARLLLAGPGVFAASAAASVRADVERVSLLAGALLLAFLLWRYRSPAMLLVAGVPLLAGTLAGALAVALVFGRVQGAALGFGVTMLGVAVDYPILLLTGREPGEALGAAARRIWPTLRLAAAAAALGLVAMMASGFPGLAQLGLFGAAGLLAGVAVTRWGLPLLVPGEGVTARPLPLPVMRALGAAAGRPALAAGAVALALGWMAIAGPPRWEDDIARLSPVPEADRNLDTALRAQLGAPDVRHLIAIRGGTEEAVLRASERVAGALAPLLADGRLAGLDLPGRYLPSRETQAARQAALPGRAALEDRLAEAMRGLPFRPGAFAPFLDGVEASRSLPFLDSASLGAAPLISTRLSPLLSHRGEGWHGLGLLAGARDPAAVRAAVAGLRDPAVLFVDVKGETEGMIAATTRGALLWCGVGAAAVLGLLALGLGGIRAALLRVAPIAGAVLVTLAALSALGERLTPFHLAALLLMAGVGLDYALFLGRREADPEASARTLSAVLTCTVTTLLTFGMLALCETPVLRGIGLTVSVGVAAAFGLALLLVPKGR
ncbi:MMPL family transporter [Muricoccus pecuniae]|uniref:Putative exporter n=1 Tax=Muricoccus pecuniae TaxID=693023 RepID=A0A840Y663_9PROT|nr:MMPL family transporter [Roseomonas pecuniae]MBB5694259.1 putative exporter [Roseomonas pecuniae]